jgi:hypothetical protein
MGDRIIQTATPGLRWRQVQVVDEGWQLERVDPTFKAASSKEEYGVDGWRPLACVWMWEWSSKTDKPWRGEVIGPEANFRDYTTRESAFRWTEKRVGAQHLAEERSTGMDDLKTITIGFRVPADLDITSEEAAALKQVIIDALGVYRSDYEGTAGYDNDTARRVNALLTES